MEQDASIQWYPSSIIAEYHPIKEQETIEK